MGSRSAAGLLVAVACAVVACAPTGKSARTSADVPASVSAEAWRRITEGIDSFLDQVEPLDEYPPGTAMVIVTGDRRRYIRVHGETKAGSGYAVTADSAFYIASMTK